MSTSSPKKRFRAKVPPEKRKRIAQACTECRKRKRKCRQQESGICVQCQENQTECHSEAISREIEVPFTDGRSISKWRVPPAAQQYIEDEVKQLHPGMHVPFEVIRSAALAMEKYRVVEDVADTVAAPPEPQYPLNEGFLDHFSKQISQAVGRPIESPTPTGSLHGFDDHHELLSELLTQLPLWPKADTLISAFFHYGESNWYYCDQERFRKRLDSIYQHGIQSSEATPEFVCLTLMALAMGSHFQHLPTLSRSYLQNMPDDDNRLPGRRYFEAAQQLLPYIMQHISIESVQSTVLMALFLLPVGQRKSNYTLIGLSLRMAMALSLHRRTFDTTPLAEESRRVFWTVWCLEKRLSLVWRAPDMLREREITAPMPAHHVSLDSSNPQKLVRLRAFVDLTKIQSYAAQISTSEADIGEILKIEERLQIWNQSLPDSLRSYDPDHMRATIHLQVMYNLIWMELGRAPLLSLVKQAIDHQLADSPTSADKRQRQQRRLAELCASSAHTVLRLVQSLRQVGRLAAFSYSDFHACSSAVVLILVDSLLHPRLGVADAVGVGIETLEMLAFGNEYAQRGVTLVKRFCKMVGEVTPGRVGTDTDAPGRQTSDRLVKRTASAASLSTEDTSLGPGLPIVDVANSEQSAWSVNDVSYAGSSCINHSYEEADFAALEAIMGPGSDLWTDDQNVEDLCFFGFSGVGPGIL
ncbi:hypothetical protein PV10_04958 [Exophiala mesophila]|uniref:Zn(2)-C6 fungal-type domain-containing protein n=1 Tax=Exophiala mesophila TaxID=212818 RepID=A0A0D1ZGF9_EXOME|nr:uncharacterized protein PV10_04958 [Exophiala mesophila]KIV93767.1 hypothetical protein PV10_04958 [Exophiala mesophila]